ncbi:MAG: amidohydrolase family protein [Acidobacteriia bacterium]|nr:amidohydrolase family protein [Terriglobia bacterium]
MRQGLHIYDTHTHLGAARHSGRQFSLEQMLASMDRYGVDRSMLIPFPVVEDYRQTHDAIAAAMRAFPDRFAGAACLNPFVPEQEYLDEIRRCSEDLGFRAIKLQPQYQALNPLSARSDFLWKAAVRHKMPVIVHTGAGAPFALPSLYIMPARRFPDLTIVLGHSGGGLYALEAIVAACVCPNIYLELSSLMPHHIREVLSHVPASRLMAGSDVPESLETELNKIFTLEIDDADRREILWNTPRRVFDGFTA